MKVVAVSRAPGHRFSRTNEMWINLIAGFGVEGDANSARVLRAGVMSIVLEGGEVRPGDLVRLEPPAEPRRPLRPL